MVQSPAGIAPPSNPLGEDLLPAHAPVSSPLRRLPLIRTWSDYSNSDPFDDLKTFQSPKGICPRCNGKIVRTISFPWLFQSPKGIVFPSGRSATGRSEGMKMCFSPLRGLHLFRTTVQWDGVFQQIDEYQSPTGMASHSNPRPGGPSGSHLHVSVPSGDYASFERKTVDGREQFCLKVSVPSGDCTSFER
jgi:hypothetical protein